jgi:tetratricopeptide (TPR) repeat protein
MNAQRDVLLVILTSHGSPAGVAVKTPGRAAILTPLDLFTMLDATHVRHRIVIVSACFSGVFIPPLADPDTLVITAADAEHPSFGCRDGNTWTYFGDAFFNIALRQTANLRDAFALASAAIRERETQEHFVPSSPQMAGGENVERMLSGAAAASVTTAPDARYAPAFAGRGEAYGVRREFDRAIAAYAEAIRLDPKYAPAYAGRGFAYHIEGDLEHAIADYSAALKLEPRFYVVYYRRGLAYGAKRDNNHALADFSEAIRLNPSFTDAFAKRALAYRALGDNEHAEADLKEAARLKASAAQN